VSSLRLDCVVAELACASRSKANEIIRELRVFVNYENEENNSRNLKEGDILTIRGKGKFIIESIVGYTKKNRIILKILQY
jgi:RNA-binding protein YlmH